MLNKLNIRFNCNFKWSFLAINYYFVKKNQYILYLNFWYVSIFFIYSVFSKEKQCGLKKRPRSSRTLKSLKIAGSVLLFRVFFGFRKERVWCNIRSTDWTNYTSICQKDIEGYYYRNLDIWSIRNGDLLIDRE